MADIHAKLQEEKILRAIRAKRRFRAAVLHVIHNLSWLQDDDDDIFDPSNVKQTVTRLTRRKKPGKGLSIREKAVLRKQLIYRTDAEKKLLNKYIGGLKCFRRYPENVQLELVGVTYFEYYPRGRVLVRQNDEAHAMYFLLSGEVIVTKKAWDEIANVEVDVLLSTIVAGNMFGEVSLLHNVPRTATVTTTAPCELLVLKKEDFDRVLKASLMQRWDDIRDAMTQFTYFDHWDSVAIRECCILSKIKTYTQNQVVFGDRPPKKGTQAMSYFLIAGRCSIVEHLFIEEIVKRGVKYYNLYNPPDSKHHESHYLSYTNRVDNNSKESHSSGNLFDRSIEITDGSKLEYSDSRANVAEERYEEEKRLSDDDKVLRRSISERRVSIAESEDGRRPSAAVGRKLKRMSIMSYKNLLRREFQLFSDASSVKLPPNVRIRFMQICTLGEKATFIEGDLMKNRRVIALTPVKVLLIPSYWLHQHNKGNVWTRVEEFLHKRIPSRQTVFKAYVNDKKWLDYRRKLRDDTLSQRKFANNTTIHDVPYSIRVVSNYE